MISIPQSSSGRALDLLFPTLKQRQRGSLSLPFPSSKKKKKNLEALALMMTSNNETSSSCSSPPLISGLAPSPLFHSNSSQSLKKKKIERNEEETRMVTSEKLDEWLRDSIGEIVRSIREAPFLVQMFSSSGSTKPLRLEQEEALPESWPLIKKRWDRDGCRPDGIVLVEELRGDEERTPADDVGNEEDEDGRRTWGLVVQGRGLESASCYILNTCRVRSTAGFCTHFCLVRAKCFGGNCEMQLKKAWLH